MQHYTKVLTAEIGSILSCLLSNSDSVVTEILKKERSFKREEIGAIYRTRFAISSSINRLFTIDGLDLTFVDFSSELSIKDFYIKNNIIDELRCSQICFPQYVDDINVYAFMLSVEIACIYLDIRKITLLNAKETCEGESRPGMILGAESIVNYIFDNIRCYESSNVKFDFYNFLETNKSIKIKASQHGIKRTQIGLTSKKDIDEDIWMVYLVGDYNKDSDMISV